MYKRQAAYQCEGGWKEGGKGLSNWDVFCHSEKNNVNPVTGDVACDFYHHYEVRYSEVLRTFVHLFVQNEVSKELLATIGVTDVTVAVSYTHLSMLVSFKEKIFCFSVDFAILKAIYK